MIRTLFLIPNLMHGGAEKVLVNLVNNLDENKYDVTLYSIFDGGVNRQFLKNHVKYRSQFKKVFRGNSQLMKFFSPQWLYRFFIKDEYDIVVSFLEGPAARIISGCPDAKTKKVAWIHTDTPIRKLASIGFRDFAEAQYCYNKFNAIVSVSESVRESFSRTLKIDKNLHVLYNVNETEIIRMLGNDDASSLVSETAIKICTVGKISANKGFDRLLEAHYRLLAEGLYNHIYILGIGEDQTALEKKIKDLGVAKSFTLLGFHENPYKFMSKCDIYVCASHREGFSTAVTEALILGVATVSTEVSGARELLGERNEYGIVTENSTEGIYQGIKTLLEDPQKLVFYTQQAQIRGLYFSKDKTVKAVENLFDSL